MLTKAWEVKNLVDRLKAKGLAQAEAVLKVIAGETIDWASESLAMSDKSYLKFCAPIVAGAKPIIIEQIDKIDGKKDPAIAAATPAV